MIVKPEDVLAHAAGTYADALVKRLNPKAMEFLVRWCNELHATKSLDINQAWASIPAEERDDSQRGRIVAELLMNYVNHLHRKARQ